MRQLGQMIVRLNVETQSLHAAADARWLDLIAPGRTISRYDYLQVLVQQYGFVAPLESSLAYTPHLDGIVDLHRRFRAGAIVQDLLTLGVSASSVAQLRQCMIAPFGGVAEALGWLYVHQRSTLLHDHVLSELRQRCPELEPATSCLQRDAGHVGARWDDFGQEMERVARTPAIQDRIIEGARDGFRTLNSWHRAGRDIRHAESP